MRNIHHIVAGLSFLVWLAQASSAQARTEEIIVDEDPEVAKLTIRPGTVYPIKLDSPIKKLGDPNHPYARVFGDIGSKELRIEIASGAPDFTFRPIVETEAEYTVIFVIRATTEDEPSEAATVVYKPPNELDERAAFLLDEMDPHHSSDLLSDPGDCEGSGVRVCGLQWTETANHGLLRFVIQNHTRAKLDPTEIEVQPELGGANHALMVRLGSRKPTSSQQIDARIHSMEHVQGMVLVRDPKLLGNQVRFYLRGVEGTIAVKVVDLRPPKPKPPEPAEGSGRIVLRLQPSIGAVWLPNPVDDKQLGAAMLTSLGMRATYAMNQQVRIETELSGIRSTEARFRDVPYNGMTGDMLRDTTGARLLIGGNLRIGKRAKYAPFVRAGLGFQTVQQSVRFTSGQETSTGPGDGFSFDFLFWFGAGLDIQLSKHWNAGLGFAAVNVNFGNSGRTFEGTLHIGYGWGGYVRQ